MNMTIQFYKMPETIQAGITLRNEQQPEQFNIGLHACENKQAVIQNRTILAEKIGLPLQQFVYANQTHSANFVKVTQNEAGLGTVLTENALVETDAMYTFEPNIVMTSMTADCVPITFYSLTDKLVGAIHSGWGGTVKEISLKLFTHLKENEQINLKNVHLQIGPALSAEKFEVDEDVYIKFASLGYADEFITFNANTNKYHIDNQFVVKRQCELAGIPSENILVDRTCTYIAPNAFSYRENRGCGRHVSFIVRKENTK